MSFSLEGQAQSSSKELKKEQRKQRKAKQRAEAEKRRTAALYADADFHDEEDEYDITLSEKAPSQKAVEDAIIDEPELAVAIGNESTLTANLEIERYAYTLEGIPYRYGGMDKKGFDCSGFSCHVFSESGIRIPRTAQAQYDSADIIPLRKAEKGDLLFFGKNKRKISHVGIVISKKGEALRMIHSASSGGIMVTTIDTSDYWKNKLLGAGRYLSKSEMRAER